MQNGLSVQVDKLDYAAPPSVEVRLLVVDDNAVFREELGGLLEGEGHSVALAASGSKALEILATQPADVVLTDLKMPRMGGLALLTQITGAYPEILVVVITGYATIDTAVEAMRLGAFDYLPKPCRIEKVRQVLERAEQERRFRARPGTTGAPGPLLRRWVTREGRRVLRVAPGAAGDLPGVTILDAREVTPVQIQTEVDRLLAIPGPVGLLIEEGERLFERRPREGIERFVTDLVDRMRPRGPLVILFDSAQMTEADARFLRTALGEPDTGRVLALLGHPIRRAVLRRVAQGAVNFGRLMEATGIEDSPKLAFHVGKLVDEGVLAHVDDLYRLTARGRSAVAWLDELDAVAPQGGSGNAVLPQE
ncbi:MAG: ArsR/SmtB family transcription factor [Thermoplasmata archaeon]